MRQVETEVSIGQVKDSKSGHAFDHTRPDDARKSLDSASRFLNQGGSIPWHPTRAIVFACALLFGTGYVQAAVVVPDAARSVLSATRAYLLACPCVSPYSAVRTRHGRGYLPSKA